MITIKRLPNIISSFRILAAFSLLLFKNNPTFFFILYALCGISDVLDGYIARRYKWESTTGAKLDSISDFIFYAVVCYLLFFTSDIVYQIWFLFGLAIVFALRVANFIIAKVKFGEWGMLHSWANKASGLCIFLYIPFVLINASVLFVPGIILIAITTISAIEEMIILFTTKEYCADRKSLFI